MALIINGNTLSDEVIEAEFREVKGHFERTLQVACCERDPEFLATAKDNLIAKALLAQASRVRVPEVADEDITSRLEKLIAEAGGKEQFFFRLGLPETEEAVVREHVANGARMDLMLGQQYDPQPTPTDDELRAHYDANIAAFTTEETIRVSHITKGMQGAKSRADVYQTMRDIRVKLLAGTDFDELAEQERSDDQQQIDLGWFKRGEFMEEFETIAFSMNEGEISPVFTTQLGFHVCKLTGLAKPEPVPFDVAKEHVLAHFIESYRDRRFHELLTELKAEATIEDTQTGDAECSSH